MIKGGDLMDLFERWLYKQDESDLIKRALTDKSYKKVYQKLNCQVLSENLVNFELATYGDAILKMGLMQIFIRDEIEKPTEFKKKYESDEALVKYIAKRYDILKRLNYDKEAITIKDYNYDDYYKYDKTGKRKGNLCKFIATAVEAVIAAIYEETKDIDSLITLFEEWIKYIDENSIV